MTEIQDAGNQPHSVRPELARVGSGLQNIFEQRQRLAAKRAVTVLACADSGLGGEESDSYFESHENLAREEAAREKAEQLRRAWQDALDLADPLTVASIAELIAEGEPVVAVCAARLLSSTPAVKDDHIEAIYQRAQLEGERRSKAPHTGEFIAVLEGLAERSTLARDKLTHLSAENSYERAVSLLQGPDEERWRAQINPAEIMTRAFAYRAPAGDELRLLLMFGRIAWRESDLQQLGERISRHPSAIGQLKAIAESSDELAVFVVPVLAPFAAIEKAEYDGARAILLDFIDHADLDICAAAATAWAAPPQLPPDARERLTERLRLELEQLKLGPEQPNLDQRLDACAALLKTLSRESRSNDEFAREILRDTEWLIGKERSVRYKYLASIYPAMLSALSTLLSEDPRLLLVLERGLGKKQASGYWPVALEADLQPEALCRILRVSTHNRQAYHFLSYAVAASCIEPGAEGPLPEAARATFEALLKKAQHDSGALRALLKCMNLGHNFRQELEQGIAKITGSDEAAALTVVRQMKKILSNISYLETSARPYAAFLGQSAEKFPKVREELENFHRESVRRQKAHDFHAACRASAALVALAPVASSQAQLPKIFDEALANKSFVVKQGAVLGLQSRVASDSHVLSKVLDLIPHTYNSRETRQFSSMEWSERDAMLETVEAVLKAAAENELVSRRLCDEMPRCKGFHRVDHLCRSVAPHAASQPHITEEFVELLAAMIGTLEGSTVEKDQRYGKAVFLKGDREIESARSIAGITFKSIALHSHHLGDRIRELFHRALALPAPNRFSDIMRPAAIRAAAPLMRDDKVLHAKILQELDNENLRSAAGEALLGMASLGAVHDLSSITLEFEGIA